MVTCPRRLVSRCFPSCLSLCILGEGRLCRDSRVCPFLPHSFCLCRLHTALSCASRVVEVVHLHASGGLAMPACLTRHTGLRLGI